jgi:hypothetical protein
MYKHPGAEDPGPQEECRDAVARTPRRESQGQAGLDDATVWTSA